MEVESANSKMEVASDDSDTTYDVEAILKKRKLGAKTQYLIKWKDFPEEFNCWTNENDIATELTAAYNQTHAAAAPAARSKKAAARTKKRTQTTAAIRRKKEAQTTTAAHSKKEAPTTAARVGRPGKNKMLQNQENEQPTEGDQIDAGGEAGEGKQQPTTGGAQIEADGGKQQPAGEAQIDSGDEASGGKQQPTTGGAQIDSGGEVNGAMQQATGEAQIEAGDEASEDASEGKRQTTVEAQMEAPGEMEQTATSEEISGLARGLPLEKIYGITGPEGDRIFLVKCEGSNQPEFVAAKVLRVKWPQQLIDFYESNLKVMTE